MLFSNLLLSISILLSIVPTVLSGCRFSRFPLILRPRLGNWYIMRDLDETSPGFLRVEKDFEEQYIDGQSTVKHLFLSVKTNHDPHSRLTIFTRLFDIFTSARIKRYKIILRIHYAGGEPGDFGIIEIDVLKWAAFLANHTDVLYVVQAGWLGIAYGEWWGMSLPFESIFLMNIRYTFNSRFRSWYGPVYRV